MVDTVVIQSTQPEEDPKHVEAMIAKADAAGKAPEVTEEVQTEETNDRPGWLPEKFKSPEDLAKAYAALEAKLGKPAEVKPEVTPEATEETPTETKEVEQVLEAKGLSLDEFSQEFSQRGELSPESYDALEKAGYPRNIVDQYIDGQKARAALYESEVKAVAGGDKGFTEMVEWATANLNPQQIAAYNAAIDSGNPENAKLAVAGLYQQFSAARPAEPSLFTGSTGTPTADVYESVAQLQKDMASKEYKTDPAFRSKVQSKLGRSNIL